MKILDKPQSDSELVQAYIEGNENALSLLINKHQQYLYNFIYSKVFDKDLTEDIFQDTFIKVVRTLKKGNYKEQGKFLSWVMRIAHNLIIDHFRKKSKIPKFENTEDFNIFSVLADENPHAEKQLIDRQTYEKIHQLLDELPAEQLEVLKMRIFKDMSFKEISIQTDVSINTALGRMRYALINLRKVIHENDIMLTQQ